MDLGPPVRASTQGAPTSTAATRAGSSDMRQIQKAGFQVTLSDVLEFFGAKDSLRPQEDCEAPAACDQAGSQNVEGREGRPCS